MADLQDSNGVECDFSTGPRNERPNTGPITSKFYAIHSTSHSETFLLVTKDWADEPFVILVDCGYVPKDTSRRVLNVLRDIQKTSPFGPKIHRVICTSTDLDHCRGIADFIKDWVNDGGSVEEFWGPVELKRYKFPFKNGPSKTIKALERGLSSKPSKQKMKIRWFSFKEYLRKKECNWNPCEPIWPINAVEVDDNGAEVGFVGYNGNIECLKLVAPSSPQPVSRGAKITKKNLASLVFYKQQVDVSSGVHPAVLFGGDSALSTGSRTVQDVFQVPPGILDAKDLLVTAFHHGSKHNARAYDIVAHWGREDPAKYVRGGTKMKIARGLSKPKLYNCAFCECEKSTRKSKTYLTIPVTGGRWRFPKKPAQCSCIV